MLPSPAAAIGDPVSGSQFPAVGIFLDKATQRPSNCSAVLIGCRSVLCNFASRYSIGRSQIPFPNAGRFDIVDVKLHPGLADIYDSGVAVLVLDRPVTGITPARVRTLIDPPDYAAGTPGTVVSYNAEAKRAARAGRLKEPFDAKSAVRRRWRGLKAAIATDDLNRR